MSDFKLTSDNAIDRVQRTLASSQENDGIDPHIDAPEFIMKVCSRDHPQTKEGTYEPYDLFTFVVRNETGKKISCVAYGTLVNKFAPIIKIGEVVRINKAGAKLEQKHNSGTVNFVIRLRNETEVTPLYKRTVDMDSKILPSNSPLSSNSDDNSTQTKKVRFSPAAEPKKRKLNNNDKMGDVVSYLAVLKSQINKYEFLDKKIIFTYVRGLEDAFYKEGREKKNLAFQQGGNKSYQNR